MRRGLPHINMTQGNRPWRMSPTMVGEDKTWGWSPSTKNAPVQPTVSSRMTIPAMFCSSFLAASDCHPVILRATNLVPGHKEHVLAFSSPKPPRISPNPCLQRLNSSSRRPTVLRLPCLSELHFDYGSAGLGSCLITVCYWFWNTQLWGHLAQLSPCPHSPERMIGINFSDRLL